MVWKYFQSMNLPNSMISTDLPRAVTRALIGKGIQRPTECIKKIQPFQIQISYNVL